MYSVLRTNGAVIGYIVGDYYLPVDMAHSYFTSLGVDKQIYGDRSGSFVISSITGRAFRVFSVDSRNYEDFVSQCQSDGVSLKDIIFVPCKNSDVPWSDSNGIWKLDTCYCYQCRRGVKVLGYLLLNSRLFGAKSAMVVMLETLEKGVGDGSRIVEALKSQNIRLFGISTVNAYDFWKRHEAVFSECNRFKI